LPILGALDDAMTRGKLRACNRKQARNLQHYSPVESVLERGWGRPTTTQDTAMRQYGHYARATQPV
jgi:hypothetical protein